MRNFKKILLSFIAGFIMTYLLFTFRANATQELAFTNAVGGGFGLAIGYFLYEKYIKDDSSS